jgi:integrase
VVTTGTTTFRGEVVDGPPQTRAVWRVVPLAPPFIQALREWRRKQIARRLAPGPGWTCDDWVCSLERGPIRPDSIALWCVQHPKRHGLGLWVHDLRQGAATLVAQSGVPPRVIAEAPEHARTSCSLDVYARTPDLRATRASLETITAPLGE